MSDSYDEVCRMAEKLAKGTKHNPDIPDQDFGRFSEMGHERLKENSPEDYEHKTRDSESEAEERAEGEVY